MTDHTASSDDSSVTADLRRMTGLNVAACYQCGKCSAGCPMAEEMPLKPHQMLRLAQLDERERLLAESSLWLCLTCETCSARCPNEIDPARLIDALRELALQANSTGFADAYKEKSNPGKARVRAFHAALLGQVYKYGRSYEVGLTVDYKMRTGALMDDVLNAPSMLLRGKLPLAPSAIEGRKEVRRIFEISEQAAKETKR